MTTLTLAAAVVVGVTLGLFGGGGSILTVPLLIYLANVPAKAAIAMSLFVVAVTSMVSAVGHARAGRIRWKTGLTFGVAGMAGAYAGGLIGPHLPEALLLAGFALMMVATAIAMIRSRRTSQHSASQPGASEHGASEDCTPEGGMQEGGMQEQREPRHDLPIVHVVAEGVVVGLVTGLVGAGGGFLVVPALVLLGGMPMGIAVGTSLLVIAMKSVAGLAGYLQTVPVDWTLALPVTAAAVVGGLIGGRLAGRVHADRLRRTFGWFLLVMGGFVLAQEAPPALFHTFWGISLPIVTGVAALAVITRKVRHKARRDAKNPAL